MKAFIHLANKLCVSRILGSIRSHDQNVPGDDHIFAFPDFQCFNMNDDCLKGLNEYSEAPDIIDQQRKFNLGDDFYLERQPEHSGT